MNRELKFRAWDTKYKIMYSGDLRSILDIGFSIEIPKGHYNAGSSGDGYAITNVLTDKVSRTESNELIWMQFTGLKDKNGKEIYEGDIMMMIKSEQYEDEELQEICFDYDRDFAGWSIQPQYAETGVIIGNIYENPKLLTR